MREFERKVLLLRLTKADWTIDPDRSESIRAQKAVSEGSPWPYASEPVLPWPQSEILVAGCPIDYLRIDCRTGRGWWSQQALRGDEIVLRSELASLLVDQRGHAISVGRTHADNSPGLSVIGPDGLLDPESLVDRNDVVGIHRGADAARAWSYGRVGRST